MGATVKVADTGVYFDRVGSHDLQKLIDGTKGESKPTVMYLQANSTKEDAQHIADTFSNTLAHVVIMPNQMMSLSGDDMKRLGITETVPHDAHQPQPFSGIVIAKDGKVVAATQFPPATMLSNIEQMHFGWDCTDKNKLSKMVYDLLSGEASASLPERVIGVNLTGHAPVADLGGMARPTTDKFCPVRSNSLGTP